MQLRYIGLYRLLAAARVCVCVYVCFHTTVCLLAFCLVWVLTVGGVLLTLSVMAHAYHMIQVVGNTINDIIYGTDRNTKKNSGFRSCVVFHTHNC